MDKLIVVALLSASIAISACSASFTGPVTKRKYDVEVGCTDDMPGYRKAREEVLVEKTGDTDTGTDKVPPRSGDLECPPVERTSPEIP